MGGDARQMSIVGFEQMCLVSTAAAVATFSLGLLMTDGRCGAQNTADPLFFLHAIMGADCSMALGTGGQPYICDNQINLGEPTAWEQCLSLALLTPVGAVLQTSCPAPPPPPGRTWMTAAPLRSSST